jgi:putative membrane protein
MIWNAGQWWGVGFGLHGVFMLAFWSLIVSGTIYIVRQFVVGAPQGWGERGDRAAPILRERYARGELNREQFETMRQVLR